MRMSSCSLASREPIAALIVADSCVVSSHVESPPPMLRLPSSSATMAPMTVPTLPTNESHVCLCVCVFVCARNNDNNGRF